MEEEGLLNERLYNLLINTTRSWSNRLWALDSKEDIEVELMYLAHDLHQINMLIDDLQGDLYMRQMTLAGHYSPD